MESSHHADSVDPRRCRGADVGSRSVVVVHAAMSGSHHRAIVAEDDMFKINAWDTFYDNERGWVRRHCYSNLEERTDPPPPSVYQTPSPSNQTAAAVEKAGMGLHGTSNQWCDLGNPVDVDLMDVDPALPRDHVPAGSANEWFSIELDVNVNVNVNFEVMPNLTHHVRPEDDPLSGPAASE